MKKLFIVALAIIFSAGATFAQRIALIDSRFILDKLPEYKRAQKAVDETAVTWQKEIDEKQAALDKLYDAYDAELATISASLKTKKEQELYLKEKELRDLQKKRFGFEGDLFKKRQELVKPVQDKIAGAVKKVAAAGSYDLIIDKSEGNTIIFADPKLDKSSDVLKELGIK